MKDHLEFKRNELFIRGSLLKNYSIHRFSNWPFGRNSLVTDSPGGGGGRRFTCQIFIKFKIRISIDFFSFSFRKLFDRSLVNVLHVWQENLRVYTRYFFFIFFFSVIFQNSLSMTPTERNSMSSFWLKSQKFARRRFRKYVPDLI